MRTTRFRLLAVGFTWLALVAVACGPGRISDAVEAGDLIDLGRVQELADAFNADGGVPRLVLLLSPT